MSLNDNICLSYQVHIKIIMFNMCNNLFKQYSRHPPEAPPLCSIGSPHRHSSFCLAFHDSKCALYLTEMKLKSYTPTDTHPEM